jgi:hypothetical protein
MFVALWVRADIEVAGHDPAGLFIAWVNTISWAGAFIGTEAINRLSLLSSTRSWQTLWLCPGDFSLHFSVHFDYTNTDTVAVRVVATVLYYIWCSTRTAVEHLENSKEAYARSRMD